MKVEWVIASDVSHGRDGIGLELWLDDEQALVIFRDDTQLSRSVSLYRQDLPLALLEEALQRFKRDIPRDFVP